MCIRDRCQAINLSLQNLICVANNREADVQPIVVVPQGKEEPDIPSKEKYLQSYYFVDQVMIQTFYSSEQKFRKMNQSCLLYTSPSPRDLSTPRMPSSA
eukprot:TRINITY_DN12764_c0_g1_i1.p1 TRINITY_DN12764_c0_g1~~TRINITY_DN12764_c0_g1_i1.p1  ORF type:complete len:106 (+),score=36.38 TRINITY_DN12764_c0_g1_i1:22-318(+)